MKKYSISIIVFLITILPTVSVLAQNNINNEQIAGEETIDGYRQIFLINNGEKKYITEGSFNSHSVKKQGNYLVYVKDIRGEGQIFLYHIPTEETLQLTNSGTNIEPFVSSKGAVVWKRWVATYEHSSMRFNTDDSMVSNATVSANTASGNEDFANLDVINKPALKEGWQIVVFDGLVSKQITQNGTTTNPDIENDIVIFAETEFGDNWTAKAYSLIEKKTVDISTGKDAMYPEINSGKISLGYSINKKEFPLDASDILLLDLNSLSGNQPRSVTSEDILDEISNL